MRMTYDAWKSTWLSKGDRVVNPAEIALVGAAGRKPPRGLEQIGHHLVMSAVAPVELGEAGKLHSLEGSTPGGTATSDVRR